MQVHENVFYKQNSILSSARIIGGFVFYPFTCQPSTFLCKWKNDDKVYYKITIGLYFPSIF